MPEYLAPGVYVEETSFRQKTIEGVSTSTAGFVGPTRFGPVAGQPELLTSFSDFERIYGGIEPLDHGAGEVPNDLAHAVRAFFENGGSRLYVARAYSSPPAEGDTKPDGCARSDSDAGPGLALRARHPGAAGSVSVHLDITVGQDILATGDDGTTLLRGASPYDTVLVVTPSPVDPELYWLEDFVGPGGGRTFRLRRPGDDPQTAPKASELSGASVRVVSVSVTVGPMGRFMQEQTWVGLDPDPRHRRSPLLVEFGAVPARRATELYVPLVIEPPNGDSVPEEATGVSVVEALLKQKLQETSVAESAADLLNAEAGSAPLRVSVELAGGSDGQRPGLAAYEGDENEKTGLAVFEDLDDISIVAAPGSTRDGDLNAQRVLVASIQQVLINHCETMRYRIAVLDAPDAALVSSIREYRARMDTTRAAIYYPWVRILDPLSGREMTCPPSGFVTGIYARNDALRGVHKSPANEVVQLAIGFETLINKAQQDVLNPEGINCLRFFEGRGMRVWGARTLTSDPEWKYVALRRYFNFLERSIDKGTQWAVFEPNGHVLWDQVRRTVEDFLFNEWNSGHLLGQTTEEAYFVRCDRTTMTQNDLDNGRLVCLVGVAPLRPAEFVIFRIGQKTLETQS